MQTKEYFKEYYQKNKSVILKKQKDNYKKSIENGSRKEYYLKIREKTNLYQREWQKKQREKIGYKPRTKTYIRSREWFKKIGERDGFICKKCSTTEELTLQHKIPRCIGGEYADENLEILCWHCNIKDYHKTVKKALMLYFNK